MSPQFKSESKANNQEPKAKSRCAGDSNSHHEDHPPRPVPSPMLYGQQLQGNTLDGRFKIGSLLRIENHSEIYSVVDSGDVNLVAHVYNVTDISPRGRRYRLRNLKKCSRRAVAEVKFHEHVVLICRQDLSVQNEQRGLLNGKSLMQTETRVTNSPKTKTKKRPKTELQKEAARIKQHEKRRDQRRNKWLLQVGCDPGEGKPFRTSGLNVMGTENISVMLYLLHLAYNDKRPELRELLPPATRASLKQYLQPKQELSFENVGEMGEYLKFKHHEAAHLRLLFEKKLQAMVDRGRAEYEAVLRKQAALKKDSTEWNQVDRDVKTAHNQLMVVMRSKVFLPNIIRSAKKECRLLEKRVGQAKKAKEEMDKLETLMAERSRLKRKVAALGSWSHFLVPNSDPWAKVASQRGEAEAELDRIPKISKGDLESLREKYQGMLNMPMRKLESN